MKLVVKIVACHRDSFFVSSRVIAIIATGRSEGRFISNRPSGAHSKARTCINYRIVYLFTTGPSIDGRVGLLIRGEEGMRSPVTRARLHLICISSVNIIRLPIIALSSAGGRTDERKSVEQLESRSSNGSSSVILISRQRDRLSKDPAGQEDAALDTSEKFQ